MQPAITGITRLWQRLSIKSPKWNKTASYLDYTAAPHNPLSPILHHMEPPIPAAATCTLGGVHDSSPAPAAASSTEALSAAGAAASDNVSVEHKVYNACVADMTATLHQLAGTSPSMYMLYDSGSSCVIGVFDSLEKAQAARRSCTVGNPPRRVELVDSWIQRIRLNELFDPSTEDPDLVDGPGEDPETS